MTDPNRYESADLEDYEVRDTSETLDDDAVKDPLDTGVAPPQHWSAGMRFGTTAEEEERGESLDQLLAEEVPDQDPDADAGVPESYGGDEDEGAHPSGEADLVARDAGIDGGAASAEEAAVHVVSDDDTDIRSEG